MENLEEFAYQFLNRPEHELRAIGYGLVVLGGIFGGLFIKSDITLQRAPYFVCLGITIMLYSIYQFMWLSVLKAASENLLWILVSLHIAASFVSGFFWCIFAKARSQDEFGTNGYAALAFVPLLNFILLLKPSKNSGAIDRKPMPAAMSGSSGVLLGFLLLAAAVAATVFLNRQIDTMVAAGGGYEVSDAEGRWDCFVSYMDLYDGIFKVKATVIHNGESVKIVTDTWQDDFGTLGEDQYFLSWSGVPINGDKKCWAGPPEVCWKKFVLRKDKGALTLFTDIKKYTLDGYCSKS